MTEKLLLWIVTALYGVQAIVFFVNGKPSAGLILAGYVVANVGLIWAA